jgi:hypothetical protein
MRLLRPHKDYTMITKRNQAPSDSTDFKSRFLSVTHGISRGRDTFGYNRVTVADTHTGQKFTATGGGYDMLGTCFGEWMEANIQDRLDALKPGTMSVGPYPRPLYGISYKGTKSGSGHEYTSASVDGGCGLSSMIDVARACGIEVEEVWDRSTRTYKRVGFNVRAVGVQS